jgi:hypothetical protein
MPSPLRTARARTRRDAREADRVGTPIYVANAAIAGAVLTLAFDQPVSLAGVPAFTTDLPGPVAVSAARTAANAVAITFSDTIEGSVTLYLGFRDPAIRNASGGYVTSNSIVL